MFPGETPNPLIGEVPNTGWLIDNDGEGKAEVEVETEPNGKLGLDEAPVELKTMDAAFAGAADVEDAPKENPVDGDGEVNVEPKIEDFGLCQLEPKMLEGAPLELTELVAEEEAEEIPPKVNIPEVPLLKELVVLIPEAEAEELTELNIGGAAPLPDPTAPAEEEEPKPKVNMAGLTPLLELTAVSLETAVELAPNLGRLDAGPLPGTTVLVSDEEAEELNPKDLFGTNP